MTQINFKRFLESEFGRIEHYFQILSKKAQYAFWFLKYIYDFEETEILESIIHLQDNEADFKLNALNINFENNESILLSVNFGVDKNETQKGFNEFIDTIDNLFEISSSTQNYLLKNKIKEFSEFVEAYDIDMIDSNDTFTKTVKVIFIYYYDENIHCNNVRVKSLKNTNVDLIVECYSIKQLDEIFINKTKGAEPEYYGELELIGDYIEYSEENLDTIVGTTNAFDLVSMYKKIGDPLYLENVREYLGPSKVNKTIMKTALSDERNFFWYYNNGIIITCEDFSFQNENTANKIHLKKPQIINGCQTVNSLYFAEKKMNDKNNQKEKLKEIHITVKIIKKSSKVSSKIMENIRFYTNSQEAIRESDFRSADAIQSYLSESLKDKGFFYEFKKGSFRSYKRNFENKPDFVDYERENKLVNIYDVAQYIMSFFWKNQLEQKLIE